MRRRRCPVVLLVFIALHATPFAGAHAQGDPRSPLSVYGSIAEEYRRGSSGAATQLVALGPSRLMELHDLMGRAVRQPLLLRSGAQPWTPALLRAAGMLHTDVALQAFTRGDVPEFQQHLDAADRVLQLAELSESADHFRARWHAAIGLELLGAAEVERARAFLTKGCNLFSTHARLRLACGVTAATYASRLKPTPADASRWYIDGAKPSTALADERRRLTDERDQLFREAMNHYESARAADAALQEVPVRMAAIHILRGRDADAERLLVPIVSHAGPSELRYVARLLLGGIRERQRQTVAAAALYHEAMIEIPGAQSARIALAYVLHITEDRARAKAIVDQIVTASNPVKDPWERHTGELIATKYATVSDLRREARK